MCFLRDESGALTVDWVVMAAAVVGLGVATVASVRSGTQALGTDVSNSLSSSSVASLGTLGATATAPVPLMHQAVAMIGESMWATAGGRCTPGPGCPPATEYYEQDFEMADGSIAVRRYEVVNGQVTTWSWTDSEGNNFDGESPCNRSLPCAS